MYISFFSEPQIPDGLKKLRENYKRNGIPTILEQSLNLLILTVSIKKPLKILEIGTATGMSGIAMLSNAREAELVTIEKDEDSFLESKANFKEYKLSHKIKQFLGDAGDILTFLDGHFDFIFLDGAKARYYDYLHDVKRLLAPGGVLFADNVLFRGFVDGSEKHGHGNNTIVRNLRAFINDVVKDDNFITQVINVGDGILISQKKNA